MVQLKMKSLRMHKYGQISDSLDFIITDQPAIGDNQVQIQVHAASINPIDYKVLRGDFKAVKKLQFPAGIGRDVSGVITAIGNKVSQFKLGDAVVARVDETHVGTLAEYAISEQQHLSRKPEQLSHLEAASIPLAGLTAYQALIEIGQLKWGQSVLIHAGSGGVGSVAVQLAKSVGAKVISTTSTNNVDMVTSLGADQVIDYKKQDYLTQVAEVDLVFDTLGGEHTLKAFQLIKPGGRVISIAGELCPQSAKQLELNWLLRKILAFKARHIHRAAKQKQADYRMILMQPNGEQLSKLMRLYNQGSLKTVIDRAYPLSDSISALNYLATGRAKGKVVIYSQV